MTYSHDGETWIENPKFDPEIENDEPEGFTLKVYFNVTESWESHGLPGPREHIVECEPEEYELDGTPIEYDQLVAKFGNPATDDAIELAMDNGYY
jgi:hypothetical protein